VAEASGGAGDELADTVDYRDVVGCVRAVSDGRRFNLIEALAAAVADTLLAQFPVTRVRVRVRKPDVRLDAPVAYAAATIERAKGAGS
jgi:dihydroneopterin aldolase